MENELRLGSKSPHLGQGHDDSDQDIWITCIWINMKYPVHILVIIMLCCTHKKINLKTKG